MNSRKRLEVEARAFNIMTGRNAPFNDPPANETPLQKAERSECWHEWRTHHQGIIKAMFYAFEDVMRQ